MAIWNPKTKKWEDEVWDPRAKKWVSPNSNNVSAPIDTTSKAKDTASDKDNSKSLNNTNATDWNTIVKRAEELQSKVKSAGVGLSSKKGMAYTKQRANMTAAQDELNAYLKQYGVKDINELRQIGKQSDDAQKFKNNSDVMNYAIGIPLETRQSIYETNKKRIQEIDAELANTTSGKTSFWQSENPIAWITDKYFTDSTKKLEDERKELVEANALYEKYGNAVDLSYSELVAKREEAEKSGDNDAKLYYKSLENQKYFSDFAEKFSKIKIDGEDISVLDAMNEIAQMEDGEAKDARVKKVKAKLSNEGFNYNDFYSQITGDSNVTADYFFKWLGSAAWSGLASWNKGWSSTLSAIEEPIRKILGVEESPISQMADYYSEEYDNAAFDTNYYSQMMGGGAGFNYGGQLTEQTVAALPDLAVAIMTFGASKGASITQKGLSANTAYNIGNTATKANITLQNMMKNPQYWTSFARTFGTDYEAAKQAGADDTTAYLGAMITSLVNSGIEIGLDGQSGIQGLTKDVLEGKTKRLYSWIESSLEEGTEEVVQGFVNNAVSKVLYDSNTELLNPKEMATEFGMGTAVGLTLGGGTNVVTNAVNYANKVRTEKLTDAEQAVVDKVVESRVKAEEEKTGKKLTKNERATIEAIVEEELRAGGISTDIIEETLGGDVYTNYKKTRGQRDSLVSKKTELQKELAELENAPNTIGNAKRYDAIEGDIKEIDTKIKNLDKYPVISNLKAQLEKEMSNTISRDIDYLEKTKRHRGSYLAESYNEVARRGQAFEADLSQYNEKQRRIVQKAIDSGVLNNTNRAHELVDLVAKVGADKDLDFDFADNEKLKKSGFALEGVTVNGFLSENGVTINLNSQKALNSVVGHEIAHVLEGTDLYNSLQSELKSYLGDAEYNKRLDSVRETYKNIYTGEDAETRFEQELTADLVGDLLFTDSDFVNRLYVGNRNVFQKLFDEIKYLCRVATAGSKEARQLEKLKKTFEDVYNSDTKAQKNTATEDGAIRWSISSKLSSDIDSVLKGTFDASKSEVYLGETSNFLTDVIGAESLSLYMPASKVYSSIVSEEEYNKNPYYAKQDNYHGIGKDDFIEILEKSEKPIAAFASRSDEKGNKRQNRIVLVTDKLLLDKQTGKTGYAVVVEEVDSTALSKGKRIKANKTITIYPRTQLNSDITEAIADGRILDITKKGEQLLAGVRGSNPQAAIQETVLKKNIANFWANVKWEKTKNKTVSSSSSNSSGFSTMKDALLKAGYIDQDGHIQDMQKNRKNSLSAESEDIAPVKDGIYGKDVALQSGDIEPVKETISKKETVNEDIAPVREDAPKGESVVNSDVDNSYVSTRDKYERKLNSYRTSILANQQNKADSLKSFNEAIEKKQAEYDALSNKNTKKANNILQQIENLKLRRDNVQADYDRKISSAQERLDTLEGEFEGFEAKQLVKRRVEIHKERVDKIKESFSENGFDFDETLSKAKNLSTFSTVDNIPQRVMEKALGYKEGQILADATVNKVAQNESEGIKWLNSFTNRKNGTLAQLSKQYNIKRESKESVAAQMFAEGFYVNENNEIIQYGETELAKDFPDSEVRENIKGLARDPKIRQIYDETLEKINESRVRNGYPKIQRLENYFLHFRAMDDTFSKLGLPFNPNDIRAKDLPTDLNGVTADLKPGQPYFASSMHRTGKRTSFDLLGGLERYLSSAKNQIYHIDDIQTLRALRNYIADTYGQANGLKGLDALSEEDAQERIKQVYDSHLSTFAKFLNEEANILAGKTALIDRGLEGILGRRGIAFIDSINKQVGSNMVGLNVSSSLTNFLPVAQTFAKTNKADFIKGFAQTVSNKVKSIFGNGDGFAENSPVIIRRKGADRFYRTPFQKVGDAGYVLMSAVDDISTEIIARTKYNELTRKGMSEQQAHFETDKWVSRLMGDRSLGQMPQIYNSRMLGLITKFQLEVRNQLDSQFYDTIQDAKISNEHIESGLKRNAKIAAKVGSTFFQLAVAQHLFGMAFEAIAGYNPAFDIVDVLIKAFGFDDDEEDEDTVLDNVGQALLELSEDLPYTSVFTGGRIPISSAFPNLEELLTGKDEYGNEKSRWETIGEAAPYYILPGGYGQIKKTVQGLKMFDKNLPVSGSYTDSGNLRFPVEDTPANKIKASLFGQWASENARDYFDKDWTPLSEKQIQEYKDVDMPYEEYQKYRKGLKGLDSFEEKAEYIAGLDISTEKKNVLINNVANRKEPIDLTGYENIGDFEEFDYSIKNPGKYAISKAVGGYKSYKGYSEALSNITSDKDKNGKTISGSRKEKVINYINGLDADYGEKIILYKSEYPSDDTYNFDIVEYLNSRDDLSYSQMETILKELGFTVLSDGTVKW